MFVDHIEVFARAGDGGSGSVHFRREKYIPKGGPDGGDGGRGGDIILECDPATDNLRAFFFKSKLVAEHGKGGMGQRKTGRSGKHAIYKVPPGTVIYRLDPPPEEDDSLDLEDGTQFGDEIVLVDEPEVDLEETEEIEEEEHEPEQIADLTKPGERFVLCAGGKGGRGNNHFKSSIHRAPDEAETGVSGEQGRFMFELRQIADAGLVGFPNAGKSTLLGALSAAKPKVAAYPFTTLQPKVGILDFPGYARASIADIPGLIEGAHANIGLGHDFLRHIMRCRLLLFVVDIAGSEGRSPIEDIEILRKEIKLHDEALAAYPWVVIANKMDLPESQENLGYFNARFPKQEVVPISALEGEGLERLRERLSELIARRPEI